MAKKSLIAKAEGESPSSGRPRIHSMTRAAAWPRAVYRKFGLCRVCFREMAHRGELPGITKSSW